LRGWKKCFSQFKTLRRVIYIPVEGFRYLSRGFLLGVCNSTGGIQISFQEFIIPLVRFSNPYWWLKIPLEGFRNPSL